MNYSHEVEQMCPLAKGAYHGPAPIPEEGKWVQVKEVKDISGLTHGIGWCAPQQGTCKLTLNVKEGVIEEALVETIGCSGMTHSAAMASEILIGKTLLEALNTDLVCDAINTAMRELFLQIVYGRTQTAFSEDGLPVGAGLEDLGKGLRSQTGTTYATKAKGPRYLELAEGYITKPIISVKTVDSVEEAVAHINEHNTYHSESIITENAKNAEIFMNGVDCSSVYHNASTRFTDGFEFGLGAEIGISTQKLHARGPMGLTALTTTKYYCYGDGQIRK